MGLFDAALNVINDVLKGASKKFIEDNAVSVDKRPLLTTGAIIVYANSESGGWTPQTLKIDARKVSPQEVLLQFWEVENQEDAQATIETLLSVGGNLLEEESRAQLDERLARYVGGDASALSEPETAMMDELVDLLVGYKFDKVKLTRADVDRVTRTLAWDIERAAFIARCAYNCGYFSEGETWEILRRTRELARANFENWREYALSFIKGRALVMCNSDFSDMSDLWADACTLMDPNWGDVWAWSPLK